LVRRSAWRSSAKTAPVRRRSKLIARLYDPPEGRILLDGVDLREYDLADVRRAIGVIFQDFVRYDMRFDENVGVGEVEAVREYLDAEVTPDVDGAPTPQLITGAADKSLASLLLPRLTGGYRQMLGRRFETGVDLSREWRKWRLPAPMRDAQLPFSTSRLPRDARAEYDVFVRFNELMSGAWGSSSHRFSTCACGSHHRTRERRTIEHGTHAELVAKGGVYAGCSRCSRRYR
jgi:ATP-binding cassette subfamily B protein